MDLTTIGRGALARFGIKPVPISLTYEVTWLCNLACSYCDRHTRMQREMTLAEILAALEEFRRLGMRETNLDGGDPLTHPDIDEIVEWLVSRGINVSMNTNGILVPKKIETVRKVSRVKISLDGPASVHDGMRGPRAHERALAGAKAAMEAGLPVEFSCTVGSHNAAVLEEVLETAEDLGTSVVFQPALNSLFNDTDRDGSAWQMDAASIKAAFARVEKWKSAGRPVGNAWSSLRHFRAFPAPARPPCAAGWVIATMDPEGVLFPCGQLNRSDRSNNVVRLGAKAAFESLQKTGCDQCWCARLVEANYQWGLRVDRMLPPLAGVGS